MCRVHAGASPADEVPFMVHEVLKNQLFYILSTI